MIRAPYEEIVDRIAKLSQLTIDEIKRKIDAKKAKLSGLISNEGAAQIVAAELGISFEQQELRINDLLPGMRKINVFGKVTDIFPIRKFIRNGLEAEVASLEIADPTGSVRVVFWDTKHIDLIKNGTITKDKTIEIISADVRGTSAKELHLGTNSNVTLSEKKIEKVVKTEEKKVLKKISELQKNDNAFVKATVVQLFNPNFFTICPECGMKTTYENDKAVCVKHGIVVPTKRVILNAVIDDGSENIRSTFFHETALNLFNTEDLDKLSNPDFLMEKKQNILGAEYIFSGRMKKNVFFDREEFSVNSFSIASPEQVIKELSK